MIDRFTNGTSLPIKRGDEDACAVCDLGIGKAFIAIDASAMLNDNM